MRRRGGLGTHAVVLGVVALGLVVVACGGGGEIPAPVEPSAPECPSSGDRTCKDSSDCEADKAHCSGGRCYANVAGCPCSSPNDCGSKAHCTRGTCYLNTAGSPCSETAQCGPNAHCTVDTCYANTTDSPCSEASDCGPHSACVGGKCN